MNHLKRVLSVLVCCIGMALLCATPVLADSDHPIVVTLGDSYAVGEGNEPYYGQYSADKYSDKDWLAHRSQNSWSAQLVVGGTRLGDARAVSPSGGGSLKEGAPQVYTHFYGVQLDSKSDSMKFFYNDDFSDGMWFDVANSQALMSQIYKRDVSGYQTKHVSNEAYALNRIEFYAVDEPQITVFDYIDKTYGKNSVDYVLLQAGAFDYGLPIAIYKATSIVDPFEAENALREFLGEAKQSWSTRIRASYKEMLYAIRESAGTQANIIVVGYPEMFSGTNALRVFTPSGVNLTYTQTEMALMDEMMDYLDAELSKLIAEMRQEGFTNLYYVSVIDAFKGHGAYTDDSYIFPFTFPAQAEDTDKKDGDQYPMSLMSIKSMHPNDKGSSVIASLVQELIDSIEMAAGRMHIPGWSKDADGYCYYENDGYTRRKNGWATYNGSYYYLGEDGIVLTSSWVRYNNRYYYVGANGKAQANTWVKYNGSYYYLNSKGNPTVKAWVKYKGSYYYMGSNGKPTVNGWVKYNGNYYYMGSNGKPTVNAWVTYKGSQYYFNNKGVCTKQSTAA